MPLVEIKLFEGEFSSEDVVPNLIEGITNAVCAATREELRPAVWVIVEGVPASRWGIAGKPGGSA